jgi:hypothetical protein
MAAPQHTALACLPWAAAEQVEQGPLDPSALPAVHRHHPERMGPTVPS